MPCSTRRCPAPSARSPRRDHARHCKYAAPRSGDPGKGNPLVRVRADLRVELQRIAIMGTDAEDKALALLKTVQ
jgi:hypothetical protein